jgi:replicative DNA helicase Mcm
MEQQTISIAKANIVATLPAQTSILAGANPKLGRFDQYLPIKEQIDIPETLLSRFDMKFALRDLPNPEVDAKIADHIMRTRFFRQEDAEPVIKPDMIKKYVAYARKNCKPEMSEEAANELRNFYLTLRERSGEESPIAITPRQYEALIRLAEASAKVQLRNNVTVEDAQRAINLMKSSLRQFGFEPETGKYDIDRMEGAKSTAAQRSKIRVMIDVIDDISRRVGKDVPVEDLLKQARQEGLENAEDILRKMLNEGLIFQPRQGYINKL